MKENPSLMGEIDPSNLTIRVSVELILHDQLLGKVVETLQEHEVPESGFSQLVSKICQRIANQS